MFPMSVKQVGVLIWLERFTKETARVKAAGNALEIWRYQNSASV